MQGEIQMVYQQEKRQSKGIVPFTNARVLSGKDLNVLTFNKLKYKNNFMKLCLFQAAQYSKIYVASTSQANFRGARELSGAITKCLICDNLFDDHLIVEHYEFWYFLNNFIP